MANIKSHSKMMTPGGLGGIDSVLLWASQYWKNDFIISYSYIIEIFLRFYTDNFFKLPI